MNTPGPWQWRRTTLDGSTIEGQYFVNARLGNGHLRVLCADKMDRDDAQLIAAAPDLLDALRECASALARFKFDSDFETVRKAYEAIAKAEGKPESVKS